MRRFTLITIVVLLILLAIAAYFQIRAARGPRRFPGPGVTVTPPPASP
jgi:hypothetical protein